MKKILLSCIIGLFGILNLHAQISITNATFPIVGDKLYMGVDTFPYLFVTPPSATAQTWDYSLYTHYIDTIEVKNASEGTVASEFPGADILIPFEGGEGYAKVYNDSIEILGYYGSPVSLIPSLDVVVPFTPAATTQRVLEFGSIYTDDAYFELEIAGSQIPPGTDLPVDPSDIDSARIEVTINLTEEVDAFGTMTTPTGTYDVLRLRQTEARFTRVIVKHNFFGWWDITGFNIDGIGVDTFRTVKYLNDVTKEPIAVIDVGANGYFYRASFMVNPATMVSTNDPVQNEVSVNAYPNPAIDWLNLELEGFTPGAYTISIYNILGKKMSEYNYHLFGDQTIPLDVQRLTRGTYLFRISDDTGQVLETQRFVSLKP